MSEAVEEKKQTREPPADPWSRDREDVLGELRVSAAEGLSEDEVKKRRRRYGPNRLREAKRKSAWTILIDQFKSLMIILLSLAAILSFVFGDWIEGVAIAAVIAINAAIGFFTEMGAVRSMEALRQMTKVSTKIRRDGEIREVSADELVPGDIVILEGGDIVSADLRLIEASKLQADESPLTGESVPVGKDIDRLKEDIPLAERSSMVFKGTAITRGSGAGVVVSTGMNTELGHISSMVEEAREEKTPLEKRLDQLGQKLIWLTLAIAVFVAIAGIVGGKELLLMIETAIALAVAAVPEGLPIVATIALARGMWRMSRRNAIVNRLSAVESLGSTNVIFTDKTGTLTENRMTVTRISLPSGEIDVGREGEGSEFKRNGQVINPADDHNLKEALEVGALCNNAALQKAEPEGEAGAVGDPLEVALLVAAAKAGIRRDELTAKLPEAREEAFDSETKKMATFHESEGRFRVAVKGAPEAVLDVCSRIRSEQGESEMSGETRRKWFERNEQMARDGLRVLALATKTLDSPDSDPYNDLVLLGLVGLLDPPRTEVSGAIARCQEAGIKVVMVTGDQSVTARNVGRAVGLTDDETGLVIHGRDIKDPSRLTEEDRWRLLQARIFARVDPKQKLDLITLHQEKNDIVAMTGDGVNDAPALKKADIGVAMGKRGTQVAREAADMILKDDAFSTIIAAVEQGRIIFNNIRKFIIYLISCNISEILIVSLASLVNAPLPILPLQILFLNLVTDVFPALALGVGEGDPAIMEQPPRDPSEPIITRHQWFSIGVYGILITAAVLGAFALAFVWLDVGSERAVTISFLTLAFAQLWHVFNMRDRDSKLLRNDITRNLYIWGALILCVGLLWMAIFLPVLAMVLKLINPGMEGWLLIVCMSLAPLIVGQLFNRFLA